MKIYFNFKHAFIFIHESVAQYSTNLLLMCSCAIFPEYTTYNSLTFI